MTLDSVPMHYSYVWIVASLGVCIVSSYAAFCFAERLALSQGVRRAWWLGGGSLAMGLGIWSMHYLGMVAMRMPMEVKYAPALVALSLVLAVAASAVALRLVGGTRVSSRQLAFCAVLMGAGIGAMHYTGMAAMRCGAHQHYSVGLVGLSVLVAVGFSWISLVITFRLRDSSSHSEMLRVAGAVLMGLGIAAMHYTAMTAVTFSSDGPMHMAMDRMADGGGVGVDMLGGLGVLLTTTLVLVGALVTAFIDRVTYQQLRDAHAQLETAHVQLVQAQGTLLESERALAEANRKLQELSFRDGLTRLYNRRYFDHAMEAEWRRMVRERATIAFLMIDVDHFKRLNDSAGHPAGDFVLKSLAETLGPLVESMAGVLARFGGEELAAVLPVRHGMQAYLCAEQLREAVATLRLQYHDALLPQVTVSIGVATATSRSFPNASAALTAADEALYRAKQLGRNRVEAASLPEPLAAVSFTVMAGDSRVTFGGD